VNEQSQQEPLAWWVTGSSLLHFGNFAEEDAQAEARHCGGDALAFPVYKHPTNRKWVGLTLEDIPDEHFGNKDFLQGATWARAKLKELNT
jgi:hypothetical protein